MKIAFFEIEDWQRDRYAERLPNHQLTFKPETLTAETALQAADAEIASVFVYSKVDTSVLERMPNLKLIATRSMGFDHIDLEACRQRNITVCTVPDYGSRTVAEHAIALILACSRNLHLAFKRTERGQFDYRDLQGRDLYGKTLGIVGGGRIGQNVAKIARGGFEMNVLVYDPFPKQEVADKIGFSYVELDRIWAESDVISLHAPLTPGTRHTINRRMIDKLKPEVIIVNTARGGLIDHNALLDGLDSGRIWAAGLDVLTEESFVLDENERLESIEDRRLAIERISNNLKLISRNNVVITPHIGFNSREADRRIIETTVQNIEKFIEGGTC